MAAINKHLEKADRLLQKDKLEAALEELLLARKDEPGDDSIVLTVADVYHRLNRLRECRQCYAYLFDKYAERTEIPRALEFFRKLQSLGQVEPKRLVACAHLVEKQKPEDAAEYYRRALEAVGSQDPETSLVCLQGLAALQPASLETQQRIAELAGKTGKKAVAAAAYTKVGELLTVEKKYEEAVEALEQAYRLSGATGAAGFSLVKACSRARRFARVLEVLGTEAEQSDDPRVLGFLAEAYHAEKQLAKAEPVYWKLSATAPEAFDSLAEIAMEYLRQEHLTLALPLLKKLEQQMSAAKDHRGLIALADKMSLMEHSNIAVLEFLSHLADQLHLDSPLAKSLTGLFGLYFASGEFHKATDVLERLIDVDTYDPESFTKLQQLEGKITPAVWKELAARLGRTSTSAEAPAVSAAGPSGEGAAQEPAEEAEGGNLLGDLILQAEIFLQYKLQDKARERLQRIAKLYPGEEEKNEELRGLYEKAKFSPGPTAPSAHPAPAAPGNIPPDWSRISDIIRNLSRQGTVKGVLSVAANDIGRLWQASRCMVGLATLTRPPSMVLEYISPGVARSEGALLGRLVMGLQQIAEEQGSALLAEKASDAPQLASLKEALAALQVQSLVVIPLRDGDQPAGILVLEQCGSPRSWGAHTVAALETLAEQIVLAVSNARMRSLMKTLAVTDERSGLLHRESYLTCLLSEVERMREQKTPLTAAVLEFSEAGQQGRELPSQVLEEFMQSFGSALASHVRQSDIPLKYGPYSLAVIMPATTAKEAVFMVEKMRKLASSFPLSGTASPPAMAAGVAEAVREAGMDSVDIVTELINRVEGALEEAQAKEGSGARVLAPPSVPR